jgi:predicted class III extradiol MEMO1 family dioxygenase
MQAGSGTRPPAVAGLFYLSDPDLLRTQVLDLLADFSAPTKVMRDDDTTLGQWLKRGVKLSGRPN